MPLSVRKCELGGGREREGKPKENYEFVLREIGLHKLTPSIKRPIKLSAFFYALCACRALKLICQ